MDMRIPPLNMKIMLESNPVKSRIFVRRLAVRHGIVSLLDHLKSNTETKSNIKSNLKIV